MIMPCFPWRSSPQTPTESNQHNATGLLKRRPTWLRRVLQCGLQSSPKEENPQQQQRDIPQTISAETTTSTPIPDAELTTTTTTTPNDVTKISPFLLLPAELRQKILKYTVTDTQIENTLLYESVRTSPSTWEARVYYFDGHEFAWDSEATMSSRAPFQESQALSSVHPLWREDMKYVTKQWVKRVRAIGEEKQKEVLEHMGGAEGGSSIYRGFEEASWFPKGDMKKRVDYLMLGPR